MGLKSENLDFVVSNCTTFELLKDSLRQVVNLSGPVSSSKNNASLCYEDPDCLKGLWQLIQIRLWKGLVEKRGREGELGPGEGRGQRGR